MAQYHNQVDYKVSRARHWIISLYHTVTYLLFFLYLPCVYMKLAVLIPCHYMILTLKLKQSLKHVIREEIMHMTLVY